MRVFMEIAGELEFGVTLRRELRCLEERQRMTSCESAIAKWTFIRCLAQGTRYILVVLLACHVMGRLQAPGLDVEIRDFSLVDLSGALINPLQFEGQPVVIQVWSSWCRACMIESGLLSRFADRNPDVVVLGLTVDSDWSEAQDAASRWGMRYPIVAASSSDEVVSKIHHLPTTLVFSPEGKCLAIHTGLVSGFELSWYLLRKN